MNTVLLVFSAEALELVSGPTWLGRFEYAKGKQRLQQPTINSLEMYSILVELTGLQGEQRHTEILTPEM